MHEHVRWETGILMKLEGLADGVGVGLFVFEESCLNEWRGGSKNFDLKPVRDAMYQV